MNALTLPRRSSGEATAAASATRVLEQRRLDLERADAVAGGDDHVVGAALGQT